MAAELGDKKTERSRYDARAERELNLGLEEGTHNFGIQKFSVYLRPPYLYFRELSAERVKRDS